jgi:2-polyprenyl-6-methoxyphenol hydroxylase-like FAD-dependent oxidoreductase
VTVLEGRPALDPDEGSVVTLAPNGVDALLAVGGPELRSSVAAHATPTDGHDLVAADGRLLGRVSLGVPLPDGSRGVTLKRSRLSAELVAAAQARGAEVRLGCRVAHVDPDAARVTTTDGEVVQGDLLVGADGLRSGVRRSLEPGAPAPRYLGLLNFGGVTRRTDLARDLPERRWWMSFGRRAFFGAHRTGALVWWFANVPAPEAEAGTDRGDWTARLVDLLDRDAGPGRELVRAGELGLVAHGTYDLPRVPTWHRGPTGLLGDAVHAPSPSSGQGASMALEDAVVLSRALAEAGDPARAWETFEQQRRRRVERIVADGRRSTSAKTPGPVGRAVRDPILRAVFRWVATERNGAWMTGLRLSETDDVRGPRAGGTGR